MQHKYHLYLISFQSISAREDGDELSEENSPIEVLKEEEEQQAEQVCFVVLFLCFRTATQIMY